MKKFLLTLLVLIAAVGVASAAEVTYDFTKNEAGNKIQGGDVIFGLTCESSTYANTSAAITLSNDPVKITVAKKISGNGIRLWNDGLRFYKGTNNLTISAPTKITNVEIKATTDYTIKIGNTNFTKGTDGVFTYSGEINDKTISITTTANKGVSYIKITYEDPEPADPTSITINPAADENDVVTIAKGESITFTADAGDALWVLVNDDATETKVSNPYTCTPNDGDVIMVSADKNGASMSTVSVLITVKVEAANPVENWKFTPEATEVERGTKVEFTADNALASSYAYSINGGERIDGNSFTVTEACSVKVFAKNADDVEASAERSFTIKAAPAVGEFTFTPAPGAVLAGTQVTFTAENAVSYSYIIGGETFDGNTFTVSEECEVMAIAYNADGVEKTNTVRYTIKEAEIYVPVHSLADITPTGKYILIGEWAETSKIAAMGKEKEKGNNRDATTITLNDDLSYVFDDTKDITVLSIANKEKGKYVFSYTKDAKTYYLSGTTTDSNYLKEVDKEGDYTTFDVTFDKNGKILISVYYNTTKRTIAYNSTSNLFGTYKNPGANTSAPITLYRLIDETYNAVPETLYCFGTFVFTAADGTKSRCHYQLTDPIEMEKDGSKFTHESIILDEEEDGSRKGSFFFATSKMPKEGDAQAISTLAANTESDWAHVNKGTVYSAATDGEDASDGHSLTAHPAGTFTARPHALKAEAEGKTISIDFSGFHPVMAISRSSIQTGIEGVSADSEAPVEYYNLQGVRVAEPTNGIYIRRQGSTATKVIL